MTISSVRAATLVAVSLSLLVSCGSGDEPRFRAHASAQDHDRTPRPPAPRERPTTPTPPPTTPAPGPTVPPPSGPVDPRLLNPAALNQRAPDTFAVELTTTEGTIIIDVHRAWAPNGADRFYNLVTSGYYADVAFFRVIHGFMAQCGIHGRPEVNRAWQRATIPDDPTAGAQHNTRGMVSFATGGPNTRTTQFFISLVDNSRLDSMGFTPFGLVRDMTTVDHLYDVYGEGAPGGHGPQQSRIQSEGNTYLHAEFPELDYIRSARVL
jgi:peptidyl-prolyl cis-trans isomerase A (cyclophilin A)